MATPAVKRLMREARELAKPTHMYHAAPTDGDLFEWHFTIRGASGTDFEGGVYHGTISLPPEYPMKPPSIKLLTPNGRFRINTKICLSISDFHPETWQPSWSIRTVMIALIGFFPTPGEGAIGSLDTPSAERKKLARASLSWKCPGCGACMGDQLQAEQDSTEQLEKDAKDKELSSQLNFKAKPSKPDKKTGEAESSAAADQSGNDVGQDAQGEGETVTTSSAAAQTEQDASVEPASQSTPRQLLDAPALPVLPPAPDLFRYNALMGVIAAAIAFVYAKALLVA
eukprot:m.221070 g.221070  ORF g.221070 m.221070 type:complete len:284 (-) comp15124_c2_seq5:1329-2180(-)